MTMRPRFGSGRIPPAEEALFRVLPWAVRYTLGRSTYAVRDVTEVIVAFAPKIDPRDRDIILRDIAAARARGPGGMGMEMDERAWAEAEDALIRVAGGVQP